jgi:hypothetical protein
MINVPGESQRLIKELYQDDSRLEQLDFFDRIILHSANNAQILRTLPSW